MAPSNIESHVKTVDKIYFFVSTLSCNRQLNVFIFALNYFCIFVYKYTSQKSFFTNKVFKNNVPVVTKLDNKRTDVRL